MNLLKTGFNLTRTMKNVGRFREIVSVLSRNGFDEFIIKTGLHERIPNFVLPKSKIRINEALEEYNRGDVGASIGYRLRRSFEELGPSFVKLGQLISTREDIFPSSFISEMKKLQDQVKGIPFAEAREALERSLKRPVEDVFARIDETPIGTASIGVVYKGQLKNGEEVVVKVRRPNITKTIETDFSILYFIITQVEKVSEDIKYLSLSNIIEDFATHLQTELDYRIEALNCERLRSNIARIDEEGIFYIPKVYKEFSSEEILVLEYLDGIPFSNAQRVNLVKGEIQGKLERGIKVFVHNLLIDGFFHADLHGGNFFLLKNGKIGIIDFGLVGMLSKRSRTNLVALLYSLVNFNFENLVYEFLEVAEYDSIPDIDEVVNDVRDCLSPYIGLTVQQINFSQLFRTLTATLAQHRLYLPREWFVVFRALVTLDGVGKSLDMDFDIFGIINADINKIITQLVSKEEIIEDAIWLGRDVLTSVRGLPRHLRWFMKEFAKRNYAFEVVNRGYEGELKALVNSLYFLGFVFLTGVFTISGVAVAHPVHAFSDIPSLSWIFWSAALTTLLTGFWTSRKII